jgi:hypothetical protein
VFPSSRAWRLARAAVRDLRPERRPLAGRRLHVEPPLERGEALAQAAESGAAVGVRSAPAVVRDLDGDRGVPPPDAHPDVAGAGVLRDVRERLGDDEVAKRKSLIVETTSRSLEISRGFSGKSCFAVSLRRTCTGCTTAALT